MLKRDNKNFEWLTGDEYEKGSPLRVDYYGHQSDSDAAFEKANEKEEDTPTDVTNRTEKSL